LGLDRVLHLQRRDLTAGPHDDALRRDLVGAPIAAWLTRNVDLDTLTVSRDCEQAGAMTDAQDVPSYQRRDS